MASCDPIESPSGREWDERTKRWRERMASTMRAMSGLVVIGICRRVGGRVSRVLRGANLVEEPLDAVLAGDRFVVEELGLRRALQPQPRSDLPPQERRGAAERPFRVPPRRVVAERGVVNARLLQIRRDRDAGDGDEADPRIVDLARQHRGNLAANLVGHPCGSGALRHQVRNSTSVLVIRPGSTRSISSATAASSRSACFSSVLTVTTASAARCQRSWCSTSDTATLNFFSRSLIRRSTIRLSFSDWLPGTWSSTVNNATIIFHWRRGPTPAASFR